MRASDEAERGDGYREAAAAAAGERNPRINRRSGQQFASKATTPPPRTKSPPPNLFRAHPEIPNTDQRTRCFHHRVDLDGVVISGQVNRRQRPQALGWHEEAEVRLHRSFRQQGRRMQRQRRHLRGT